MEIKIDTEKDSKESIRKIVRFLQSLVNEDEYSFKDEYSQREKHNYSRAETNRDSDNNYYKRDVSDTQTRSDSQNYDSPGEGLFNIFNDSTQKTSSRENDDLGDDLDLDFKRKKLDDEDDKESFKKRVDIIPY